MGLDALLPIAAWPTGASSISGSPAGGSQPSARARRRRCRTACQCSISFDLVSAAGAKALGIADYGVKVGGAATLFTIAASGVPEAVAAHPPRKLVLFDGRIVARDGEVLPAPAPIA